MSCGEVALTDGVVPNGVDRRLVVAGDVVEPALKFGDAHEQLVTG